MGAKYDWEADEEEEEDEQNPDSKTRGRNFEHLGSGPRLRRADRGSGVVSELLRGSSFLRINMVAVSFTNLAVLLPIARASRPLSNGVFLACKNVALFRQNVFLNPVQSGFEPVPLSLPLLLQQQKRSYSCCHHGAVRSSIATTEAADHAAFVKDIAGVEPPSSLQCLLDVLQAKGEKISSPYNRKGILPLVVPLSENREGELTALLRWPTPSADMDMPVVRVRSYGVQLLAKSSEEYIHRALVEEDTTTSSSSGSEEYPLASRTGEFGSSLYRKGDYAASQMASVDVYLMKKVGLFPDVFERLAMRHLERGDEVSALVTGEFYANKKHFPGFGRPLVFNAELLLRVLLRPSLHSDYVMISTLFSQKPYCSCGTDSQIRFFTVGW